MKEFKGTQGDWSMRWAGPYEKEPKMICVGVGVAVKLGKGKYSMMVCNTVLDEIKTDKDYLENRKHIEADMKLMAASKDLLEALIQLLYDVTGKQEDIPLGGYLTSEECLVRAREAIKKAL